MINQEDINLLLQRLCSHRPTDVSWFAELEPARQDALLKLLIQFFHSVCELAKAQSNLSPLPEFTVTSDHGFAIDLEEEQCLLAHLYTDQEPLSSYQKNLNAICASFDSDSRYQHAEDNRMGRLTGLLGLFVAYYNVQVEHEEHNRIEDKSMRMAQSFLFTGLVIIIAVSFFIAAMPLLPFLPVVTIAMIGFSVGLGFVVATPMAEYATKKYPHATAETSKVVALQTVSGIFAKLQIQDPASSVVVKNTIENTVDTGAAR